jgi:predicted DNA-binding transcriptional regulator YafY
LETLADYVSVLEDAGADLSDAGVGRDPQLKAIENALQRLRDLGVEYEYRQGEYHLVSYGEFSPVALSEDELNTLAFLAETFPPAAPHGAAVQALIRRIADWLPAAQGGSLAGRRQRRRIDLRRRDDEVIDPLVEEKIERALAQQRLLRFAYRSPGYADGAPRIHTVQPQQLHFDTSTRHLYLEAHLLELRQPDGTLTRPGYWVNYRLGRILPDEVTVLPDKFAPATARRRRYALEYLLAPAIARLGEVSRHFDDMQIHETRPDGWVRVTATTTDLFSALRQLLRYAHNCQVLGGPEARAQMAEWVQAMAQHYVEGDAGGEDERTP